MAGAAQLVGPQQRIFKPLLGFGVFCFAGGLAVSQPVRSDAAGRAFAASVPFLFLGALVAGLLMLTAFIQAKATVYTVTNRRVAMRIGAALTVTLNLPYTQIANATLAQRKDGAGSIALELMAESKLSYLVCWPHVRAWYIAKPQPCLRCISNPQEVADILAKAAKSRVSSVQSQDRSLASNALPAE